MRIVLADVPKAVQTVRPLIAEHGLEQRIELVAMNAFELPWRTPECDGIFAGNFLHAFDDRACATLCAESFARLLPGGVFWAHEMIWNERRDGPLITALWHASIRSGGSGGQRTALELSNLLERAGFIDIRTVPRSGAYALIRGTKPS